MTERNPRVLIVEDNTASAELIALLLKDVHGVDVESASSLADAHALLDDHRPTHCVVDLQLPDGSGLDFLRDIKAESPGTLAIVVTGHGDDETKAEAMKAGADAFLVKPLECRTILDALGITGRPECAPQ